MAVVEFVTTGKILAVRKAVDFWYKELRSHTRLIDFLARCRWISKHWLVYETEDL